MNFQFSVVYEYLTVGLWLDVSFCFDKCYDDCIAVSFATKSMVNDELLRLYTPR